MRHAAGQLLSHRMDDPAASSAGLAFFFLCCLTHCPKHHACDIQVSFPFPFANPYTFMLISVKNVAGTVPGRACARKPSCAAGCRQPGSGRALPKEWDNHNPEVQVLEVT